MEEQKNKKETEKSRGKAIVIVFGAVIIALLAAVVILLKQQGQPEADAETRRNVVVNEANAEEAAAEMASAEYVEPGYYMVNMATEWHFETGDAISDNARVDNLPGNTNAVYLDVFLEDNEDEPVYSSPVIPVGSFLGGIALDKPLDAGTYDCVAVYHLVGEEQKTISTLRIAIRILVES